MLALAHILVLKNFFLLFFGNSPTGQSQTRRRIVARDGPNDADSRKDVPFWVSVI